MNNWGQRIVRISLYISMVNLIGITANSFISLPQVESVIGIAVFAVYLLFHFCAVQVSCPSNRLEELAFVFYTTYIKNRGQVTLISFSVLLRYS